MTTSLSVELCSEATLASLASDQKNRSMSIGGEEG